MSALGKDSSEVIEFMSLFAKLKSQQGISPETLLETAKSDPAINECCMQLWAAASQLKTNERSRRELFTGPVDPKFIESWREFEKQYEFILCKIWYENELPELAPIVKYPPPSHSKYDIANVNARMEARGIRSALDFAFHNADDDGRWIGHEDFIEEIKEGIAAWDRLEQQIGFDLEGVFRRRALIPFVLVPRHVSDRHGNAEKTSLFKNLAEAHGAFIYGSIGGALALMRSILEAVMIKHYKAEGSNLSERINNVQHRLPRSASPDSLHRLRMRANDVLHLSGEGHKRRPRVDQEALEREIVRHLLALRALIEDAPTEV